MVGAVNWHGQWPEDGLFAFLRLAGRVAGLPSIDGNKTLADLLSLDAMPPEMRAARLAAGMAKVRAHSGYARLRQYASFNELEAERTRLASANPVWASPVGEARLLYHVAHIVGTFDPSFTPRRATLTHQRRTLKAVQALRAALMPGAQPRDWRDADRLRRLLAAFELELGSMIAEHEQEGTRPSRADSTAAQRYWLIPLCRMLVESFGEAPPRIVGAVASMIGYAPDDSTIARYIEAAIE